jgi:hypothetical protein
MTDNPIFEVDVLSRPSVAASSSQSDNDRYVTDITYTMNYKPEINPLLIDFSFLLAGLRAPSIKTACELGFGQGLSLNFHAAGSTISAGLLRIYLGSMLGSDRILTREI